MRSEWYTTTSGGSGGGRRLLIAAVVLVLLGSGAGAKLSAALVAVLIALAVVLVLTIAAGVAWLVYRARQERPAVTYRAEVIPNRSQAATNSPPAVAPPAPREVHLHLHGVSPEQAAEIARALRTDASSPP
jgi:hypothetical protein